LLRDEKLSLAVVRLPTEQHQQREKLTMTMNSRIVLFTAIGVCGITAPMEADDGKTTFWPPAQMVILPADYLARQLSALKTQLESVDKLTSDAKPVLWVRFGIAGLALGQRIDWINDYLEDDGFEYKPSEKFGFSLFSLPYVRLYALLNDRTGTMKGRLSSRAQANVEETLWSCAKANSTLAETRRGVWDMDGSENHHMASKVSDFLVA
jgi:hypothetical protein